jgi:hypothetical protein
VGVRGRRRSAADEQGRSGGRSRSWLTALPPPKTRFPTCQKRPSFLMSSSPGAAYSSRFAAGLGCRTQARVIGPNRRASQNLFASRFPERPSPDGA